MSTPNIMPTIQESLATFNSVINECRNILRREGITGMDSMKHLTLYILARALTIEECKRLQIPLRFAWEEFMLLAKDDSRQECFDRLSNPTGNDLISHLDSLFGTKNFNFKLKNQDNHVAILKQLNKLNMPDLEERIDILGTVYENHLGSGSNKSAMRDLGQFFTDRRVCKYMTKLCNPQAFKDGRAESVLDPTMGTGGFLTSYVQFLKNSGTSIDWSKMQMDIAGYDIDEFVMSVGRINMYLSTGIVFKRIADRDTLHLDVGESSERLRFKIILANMPFGVKGLKFTDCCKRVKELKCDGTKSEPLFLNLMMAALDDGGRCAVVVPDGVLVNNSNQHNATRKYLLDHFELKRVIKMKGQFFSNTGIQPSILFFENTGNKTETIEFWEVEQDSTGNVVETMMLSVPRSKLDDSCSLDMRRYQENVSVANTGGFPMVKLGDICKVTFGERITQKENTGTLYPVYGSGSNTFRTDKYNREGRTCKIGRFALSETNMVMLMNENYWLMDSGFTIESKKKEVLLSEFLWYLLLNDKKRLASCSTGSCQKNIEMDRFYELTYICPPLSIQQEIVSALDTIYKNAATAKAAAESMKSQMVAFVNSISSRGFEKKQISDMYESVVPKIKIINKDIDNKGPVPFYNGSWKSPVGTHSIASFTSEIPYFIVIKDGGGDHDSDKVGLGMFFNIKGPCAVSGHLLLVPKSYIQTTHNYVHFYVITQIKKIRELSKKSVNLEHISKESIMTYEIPVPPLAEQEKILAILNEMDTERKVLEQMAAKAEERAKFVLENYLNPVEQSPQPPEVEESTEPESQVVPKKKIKVRVVKKEN